MLTEDIPIDVKIELAASTNAVHEE